MDTLPNGLVYVNGGLSTIFKSDDEDDDNLTNGMEYDHDYLDDPLNATVVASEEDCY